MPTASRWCRAAARRCRSRPISNRSRKTSSRRFVQSVMRGPPRRRACGSMRPIATIYWSACRVLKCLRWTGSSQVILLTATSFKSCRVTQQSVPKCPTTQPCLSATTIGFIQQWITTGAPPAAAAAATVSAPLAVTSIVPDNMESVNGPPPQGMVAFNHKLDVSQLATYSAHFEKLAPAAAPTVIDQVPARMSVSSANLRALMIWPVQPLSAGHYRLVMDAASSSQISDIAGQQVTLGAPDERGENVISTFDVEALP